MIRMLIIDIFILALLAYGVFLFLQYKEGEKAPSDNHQHAHEGDNDRRHRAA